MSINIFITIYQSMLHFLLHSGFSCIVACIWPMFDPYSSAHLHQWGSVWLFCKCEGNRYYSLYKWSGVNSLSGSGKGPWLGLLWEPLEKFGVPHKLIRLSKALHQDVVVKFDVGGMVNEVKCLIGMKHGDILRPLLFIIFIAGIMIWIMEENESLLSSSPSDKDRQHSHFAESQERKGNMQMTLP